jgi:hypothetical protein
LGSHKRLFKKFWLKDLARALREAFRNHEKAEIVSMGEYPFLGVERGEVLMNPRYVNPALEVESIDKVEASKKPFSGTNLPSRPYQAKRRSRCRKNIA